MNFEQNQQLLRQIPVALSWIAVGAMLTITVSQYQGIIEVRFGAGYLKVTGETWCELADR